MRIESLFERDIFRPINGVVKADQLDDTSVWQELDEFVITTELDRHLRRFIDWYLEAVEQKAGRQAAGKMGVWISGFFGSGKSHFLKVLSYLLRNGTHANAGQTRTAVDFFRDKVPDALFFADLQKAVSASTDVILFNIDSKADHGGGSGRDLILRVFLKVLNELQGYSGDHPHVAHMERHLDGRGKLAAFHDAFRTHTGLDWRDERDAYQFHHDEVVRAFSEALGQSQAAAEKWIDGAEGSFVLSVENFCRWTREYLDSRGPQHRLVFLVDEVGQFIGQDSHLMLSLQTITEELGTLCGRRAWVVVTSQEDMDTVLGDMGRSKKQDFSKIQGRFFPPLSLSSANVDEVIQSRLLQKRPDARGELTEVFTKSGDILNNQLTFRNCGMTLRSYRDAAEFIQTYPFVPYQFQLLQKIFEAIRKAGATGLHLARGERSMLDAFQSAAKGVAGCDVGLLVPLYDFYPSIESFLDTVVKKTIDQARGNPSLEPFDITLLQVLFLIRYVDEVKGTIDNLVTLCLDQIDGDRLALRRRIEASLARLEKETLIKRSGDNFYFLTNEERDIEREIKNVELSGGEEPKLLGELVFEDVLKGRRKHRFSQNEMDFEFNRKCDNFPIGNQKDPALLVAVLTPLADNYDLYADSGRATLDSSADQGHVLWRLGNDESLGRELKVYCQTEKYLQRKNDGTQPESTKRILHSLAEDNRQRRERLTVLLEGMVSSADAFVAGTRLDAKAPTALARLDESLEYLIQNTFRKMNYLKRLSAEPLKEVQAVLRNNDSERERKLLQHPDGNSQALDDLREYLRLNALRSQPVVLHDLLEKRYSVRPYGWPEAEVLLLLARLLVLNEASLISDSAAIPPDKLYEALTTPAKRRKIVVRQRETADPRAVQAARTLGKELFAEMGPDGEEALMQFLQGKLRDWQLALQGFRQLAETGQYPGQTEIVDGLTLLGPLLAATDSRRFVEQWNGQKAALLDLAENYRDLEHFYNHQKPAWEALQRAQRAFHLNRLELERQGEAGPALRRMHEILAARHPYALIKEGEALIRTVEGVNSGLLANRRSQALGRIGQHLETLEADLTAAQADAPLRTTCRQPLEALREQVSSEPSLAHITQAEEEALREFDAAVSRVEQWQAARAAVPPAVSPPVGPGIGGTGTGKPGSTEPDPQVTPPAATPPVAPPSQPLRRQRIVKPAALLRTPYLETAEQVTEFLAALKTELDQALANNERIQIR